MSQKINLHELIDVLKQSAVSSSKRQITAIAGPPGSGKSTIADAIAASLNEAQPGSAAVFPMDGYHFDDRVLNQRGHRSRKGAPHTFDVGGYRHMLARLAANVETEIALPVFDREIEIARAGARIIEQNVVHIITEGNYLLLNQPPWTDLATHFNQTVFLDIDRATLQTRLETRWSHLQIDARHAKMNENDLPNVDLVREHRRQADYVITQYG